MLDIWKWFCIIRSISNSTFKFSNANFIYNRKFCLFSSWKVSKAAEYPNKIVQYLKLDIVSKAKWTVKENVSGFHSRKWLEFRDAVSES